MDPHTATVDAGKEVENVEKAVKSTEPLGLDQSEKEISNNVVGEDPEKPLSPPSSSASEAEKTEHSDKRKPKDKSIVKSKDAKLEQDAAFAHLPDHEKQILRRQLHIPEVNINYFTLFRYATTMDMVILAISCFCAIVAGAVLPLMTVVFGGLSGTFGSFYQGTIDYDAFSAELGSFTLYFVYIAIGEFVTVYINTVGFIYVGEHITAKIREHYLAAILRQNIGFFDKLGAGEITTRITADTNQLQEGISEKVGLTLTAIATFFAAFVIGFVEYWKLTLIMCSVIVAIVIEMSIGSRWIVNNSKLAVKAYGEGGTVAEEVLSSVRNAIAFGTEDKLAKVYEQHLEHAAKFDLKQKTTMGILWGGLMCVMYLGSGLCFWMGSRFLVDGEVTLNEVITISFSIIIGSFALGNVGPNAQAFTGATAAAAKIFATIDRASPLDPTVEDGKLKLDEVKGEIELRNVKHIYPSRAEVVVMQDVSLVVPHGKTTALVGASGSGKSTIVGLVERFYDPVGGEVLLDGHNVQDLNLKWLRQQISLVQQEPTLFSTTIYDNIGHGLLGTRHEHASPEEKKKMIEDAAKLANAHQFITELPEGYETNVGARGFLMSGGQKQRIAIARAMVSDPKILLLDEATSALDTKSEGVVQAALDVAAKGRTTIVIAHRLSTIRDADNIVVMQEGKIVEQGTHNELLASSGAYYNLVEAQRINAEREREQTEQNMELDAKDEEIMEAVSRKQSRAYSSDPDDDMKNKLDRTKSTQSVSSKKLQEKGDDQEAHYSLGSLISLTASFNKPETPYMFVGLFWSIVAGLGNPTQSVLFAYIILYLSTPYPYVGLRDHINFWCWMYFMLAFVQLIATSCQMTSFAWCSQRLIYRVRSRAFRTMLRQDISFFDRDENSAGALTSFLSTETNHLAGLSGSTIGTILNTSTTLIAAMVVGLALAWRLALVCIACIPLMLAAGFFRFWLLARFEARAKKAYEGSASYACEATSAIRTVASLTREQDVWDNYHNSLVAQQQSSLRSIVKSSLLYAASQSIMLLVMALGFWYGGTRIAAGEIGLLNFFIAFSSIVFGAQSAGTIFSFAPDMGKAKHAAFGLKKLFDRKPEIDTWSGDGEKLDTVEGTIEFRDVHFRYPTRPEVPVLRGLNLNVEPGQYIALVGASGCGKSTTIALLERFYDPLAGGVYIDGKNVASLNVNDYRKHLALVSQEPTLYQGTIKENILLGSTGDEDSISDARVEKACKDANIYNFIMSLPDAFDTVVGSKGSMLSGGQKQRIAIARALLRDPKVLLLDEATSALDSESEKVVQAALDLAAKGRTTIAVAHRLSTIQKADMIYVFDQGRIVENGTHNELLRINGKYAELVNLQSLEKKKK